MEIKTLSEVHWRTARWPARRLQVIAFKEESSPLPAAGGRSRAASCFCHVIHHPAVVRHCHRVASDVSTKARGVLRAGSSGIGGCSASTKQLPSSRTAVSICCPIAERWRWPSGINSSSRSRAALVTFLHRRRIIFSGEIAAASAGTASDAFLAPGHRYYATSNTDDAQAATHRMPPAHQVRGPRALRSRVRWVRVSQLFSLRANSAELVNAAAAKGASG